MATRTKRTKRKCTKYIYGDGITSINNANGVLFEVVGVCVHEYIRFCVYHRQLSVPVLLMHEQTNASAQFQRISGRKLNY